ncbi:DNA repair protein RecN [Parabacteroides sp. PF5-6]|uniref:DNA repair protein RecN n=1 Tax=Parabacteroides sp. PF5-6 TaxID=1742403 RepID=UPI002405311C|nr:DNA repair protein RecN [Parabacteroides sp. PF5-6]MDF9830637.1 DNA repair protein RecN (Recombination protein N) [Parabacteroides sp. PF5-6]
MLQSLYIQNYVLIDNLDITFRKGLSVITGETGAGKSIILGALGLVIGQRADGRSIRQGAEKCVIEAQFNVSAYQLESFFIENDLEYDAETCLLRRELFASGKSRAFVNDSPVSLNILKELGARLIDIHSQHQNLLLADNRFQLKVVDVMAQNELLLTAYRTQYTHYRNLQKELIALEEKAAQSKQEEDYIRFQLEQLSDARLKPDEQTELETEQEVLSHAEEIKSGLYRITNCLNGEEQGSVLLLKEALSIANTLERYYPKAREISERLKSAYIELNDLASETEGWKEDIEFNPERLDWVNERLDVIYNLQQKHRVNTVPELIAIESKFEEQLKEIDSFDEQVETLKNEIAETYQQLFDQATRLREKREAASQVISRQLEEMIATLGIPNARFVVDLQSRQEPGPDGMDEIRFLFSAHRNGTLQPVAQTASGGEISRLMLCLKAMIAGHTALPAILFDEIDTGVSGDIADKMGEIMQALSRDMQVITITHLPQIAAKGNMHYYVYKEDTPEKTVTCIRELNAEERITEVARMLSGATLTDASLANAKELLQIDNG